MEQTMRKFPVFVFPMSLKFYLAARQTHKQLLTLYNPYDLPVRFKVLCTAPNKYTVIDPEGSISPFSCVDIVVRHTMPMGSNVNSLDKFRISMHDHTTKQVLGKRDVESRLLPGEPEKSLTDGENFHTVPQGDLSSDERRQQYPLHSYRSLPLNNTPNYITIIVGVLCSIALLWPTQPDAPLENSMIPPYLYITNTIKLVFAYVLGLITMVIFKP